MRIPRESIEYLPVVVKLDEVVTEDFEISIVPWRVRPTTWVNAPYLISGMTVGTYDVYVRVIDNPETPVVFAGQFVVT